MTRSISEHLSEMKQTLEANGRRQAEIAASLAALTKALVPSITTETPSDTVISAAIVAATHNDGPLRSTPPTLLPMFDRKEPIRWIAKAEQKFEINQTLPERKVTATTVAMEGAALDGLTWLKAQKPSMTWEKFTQAQVAQFDSRFKESRFKQLFGVKQLGTVKEYNNLFVQLASQVPGLSDDYYLGDFMNKLKRSSCSFPQDTGKPPGTNMSRFPDFNLEDKVFSKRDGIDMKQNMGLEEEGKKPPWVYRRRDGLEPTSVGWLRAV
ncbi:unnamed protein product [Cuscuta epithymum]|uniref:Retrotransposon gag domain-containing protein n=1 Tax=Cuscuta epithymum TaxID=186058 RepID=A0AAV0CDK6_9ASTE|nr:unnamed protein product [Cuscuta epithymum]